MTTTADEIVSLVKDRCFWPTSNAPMSDASILRLADLEIVGTLWPKIIAAQADYYLSTLDHAVTATYSRYRLPNRAYGPIKDVLYLDDGDEDDDAVSVTFVNAEELGHMRAPSSGRAPYVAYVDGDHLGIYPTPGETRGTIRIRYYRHPSRMLLLAGATRVASTLDLATNPNRIPVSAYTFTQPSPGDLWDVISNGNAHQLLVDGGEIDTVTGTTNFNFTTSLVGTGIQAGDYVTPAGYTPVVQLPDHMVPLLVERVAVKGLSSDGDREAAQEAREEADRLMRLAEATLSPRSEAEPMTIPTRFSALHVARAGRAWR